MNGVVQAESWNTPTMPTVLMWLVGLRPRGMGPMGREAPWEQEMMVEEPGVREGWQPPWSAEDSSAAPEQVDEAKVNARGSPPTHE